MKLWFLILTLPLAAAQVRAQQLNVPELFEMLDWPHIRIDTTLKKEGYILMQKDLDSTTAIYQYSHLDRRGEKQATVRSLVYMDVKAGDLTSRLITYRTYDEEEYIRIASWLLENGWRTKDKFDFDESKHTVYTNGKQTLRVKITTTQLKNGKVFTSYEVEMGR